jgi:hypothetical protein
MDRRDIENLQRSARKAAHILNVELTENEMRADTEADTIALRRLHENLWAQVYAKKTPCRLKKMHDDGDMTVDCHGKKFVVTTEGEIFEQKQLTLEDLGKSPDWVYAKVGTTEMKGKKTSTGIQFEQVSPGYVQRDLDEAVKAIEEKLSRSPCKCQEPTPESFGYFGGGRKNGKAKL